MKTELKTQLTDFIVANFLFGDIQRKPDDRDSLIGKGVIDSTGVLELIGFLESTVGIKIEDTEMIPQNLDSISNLMRFVSEKKQQSGVCP